MRIDGTNIAVVVTRASLSKSILSSIQTIAIFFLSESRNAAVTLNKTEDCLLKTSIELIFRFRSVKEARTRKRHKVK